MRAIRSASPWLPVELASALSTSTTSPDEAARRALDERRDRVRGDGSWFTPDRIADIKRDRGLER